MELSPFYIFTVIDCALRWNGHMGEECCLNGQTSCNTEYADDLIYVLLWSDWKARADVVKLLWGLKKECTLIVVSHDLKYIPCLIIFMKIFSVHMSSINSDVSCSFQIVLYWVSYYLCCVLSLSHQLHTHPLTSGVSRELTPLVDRAWQMEMGGVLKEQPWPPAPSTYWIIIQVAATETSISKRLSTVANGLQYAHLPDFNEHLDTKGVIRAAHFFTMWITVGCLGRGWSACFTMSAQRTLNYIYCVVTVKANRTRGTKLHQS